MAKRGIHQTWQFVYADLVRRIEAGEWKPGEAMPGVRALAAIEDVAVDTVRRAQRQLAAEGLVELVPGFGVFVAQRAKR